MTAVFFTIEMNFIQLHSYLRCPKAFNNKKSLPTFMATTACQSFAWGRSLGFGSLAAGDALGVGTTRVEVLHSTAPFPATGVNTDRTLESGSYQSIKHSKIPFPLISLSNDTLGQLYKHHSAKFLCFVCFSSKMWANNILPWICCKGCLALVWLHQIFTAEQAQQEDPSTLNSGDVIIPQRNPGLLTACLSEPIHAYLLSLSGSLRWSIHLNPCQ